MLDADTKAKLQKLDQDSKALLAELADRVPAKSMESLLASSDAGEWADLVDGMCAEMAVGKIPITAAERDALIEILAMFDAEIWGYDFINNKENTIAALNVVD